MDRSAFIARAESQWGAVTDTEEQYSDSENSGYLPEAGYTRTPRRGRRKPRKGSRELGHLDGARQGVALLESQITAVEHVERMEGRAGALRQEAREQGGVATRSLMQWADTAEVKLRRSDGMESEYSSTAEAFNLDNLEATQRVVAIKEAKPHALKQEAQGGGGVATRSAMRWAKVADVELRRPSGDESHT